MVGKCREVNLLWSMEEEFFTWSGISEPRSRAAFFRYLLSLAHLLIIDCGVGSCPTYANLDAEQSEPGFFHLTAAVARSAFTDATLIICKAR